MSSVYMAQYASIAKEQLQMKLMQDMQKYMNGLAEDNLQQAIRHYTNAINSAESGEQARWLAQQLEGLLSNFGMGLGDVQGLNMAAANGANAAKGHGGGVRGDARDKAVIKDLSDEFGIDVKKSGTTKDWAELAKKDERVTILDKNGNEVQRDDRVHNGDILVVNSQKYGQVKIQVGGDGEINGGDDKVLSISNQAAAQSIYGGLNQIGNKMHEATGAQNVANGGNAANPLLQALGIKDPNAIDELGLDLQQLYNFSPEEIKHLMAAIYNNIEEKEYKPQIQAA